jgi:drug/metabolite transporter (DMT)-like permease
MTATRRAGLADPSAQLYMVFYYMGPALLIFTIIKHPWSPAEEPRRTSAMRGDDQDHLSPSAKAILKAVGIAFFDIAAQSLNYAGGAQAGATIFAVVYSSVTVWTAVFSRCLLRRRLTAAQACGVATVFLGLCATAADSAQTGGDAVLRGTALVLLGSCMHGATYVLAEAVMRGPAAAAVEVAFDRQPPVTTTRRARDYVTSNENAAIQSNVAMSGLVLWQFFYTARRWNELIVQPMRAAGTGVARAAALLGGFGVANLVHSLAFYFTLKNYPGGAVSAGVMKGLQAVLVFAAADRLYCSVQDQSMCFSVTKFISLVTVVTGVFTFAVATEQTTAAKGGYTRIEEEAEAEEEEEEEEGVEAIMPP